MIRRISTVLIVISIVILNISYVFAGDYDRIFIQKWGTSSEADAESPARTAGGSNYYENVISKLNQPRNGGTSPHIGTDLQMHAGTNVYPIFKGKVTAFEPSTYGQLAYVTLQSDIDSDGTYDNEYIRYLHIDPTDDIEIGDIFDIDESFGKIDIDRRDLPGGGYRPHLHIERNNLIESYDRLMHFVEKHLDDPFYLEGDVRVSVRNKLFREVVANILIHREYSNPYPAKFIIEKERVITENGNKPHGFGQIDIDNFVPYPKNPVIARVFKEIGWAEELGSGIRNIKKYCKIYSDSKPVFIEGDIFRTIIEIKELNKDGLTNKRLLITVDKKPSITVDKIVEFLIQNEKINNRQAREITGLSATRIREIFKDMCDKNIIVAHGSNRDRNYTLK